MEEDTSDSSQPSSSYLNKKGNINNLPYLNDNNPNIISSSNEISVSENKNEALAENKSNIPVCEIQNFPSNYIDSSPLNNSSFLVISNAQSRHFENDNFECTRTEDLERSYDLESNSARNVFNDKYNKGYKGKGKGKSTKNVSPKNIPSRASVNQLDSQFLSNKHSLFFNGAGSHTNSINASYLPSSNDLNKVERKINSPRIFGRSDFLVNDVENSRDKTVETCNFDRRELITHFNSDSAPISGENCLVSSSTGILDSFEIESQHGSNSLNWQNPVLDSTVDSTTETSLLKSFENEEGIAESSVLGFHNVPLDDGNGEISSSISIANIPDTCNELSMITQEDQVFCIQQESNDARFVDSLIPFDALQSSINNYMQRSKPMLSVSNESSYVTNYLDFMNPNRNSEIPKSSSFYEDGNFIMFRNTDCEAITNENLDNGIKEGSIQSVISSDKNINQVELMQFEIPEMAYPLPSHEDISLNSRVSESVSLASNQLPESPNLIFHISDQSPPHVDGPQIIGKGMKYKKGYTPVKNLKIGLYNTPRTRQSSSTTQSFVPVTPMVYEDSIVNEGSSVSKSSSILHEKIENNDKTLKIYHCTSKHNEKRNSESLKKENGLLILNSSTNKLHQPKSIASTSSGFANSGSDSSYCQESSNSFDQSFQNKIEMGCLPSNDSSPDLRLEPVLDSRQKSDLENVNLFNQMPRMISNVSSLECEVHSKDLCSSMSKSNVLNLPDVAKSCDNHVSFSEVGSSYSNELGMNSSRSLLGSSIDMTESRRSDIQPSNSVSNQFVEIDAEVIANDECISADPYAVKYEIQAFEDNVVVTSQLGDSNTGSECVKVLKSKLLSHNVRAISNKPVQSRAWASLPSDYLSIISIHSDMKQPEVFGVVCRKSLPKLCKFGPVEGCFTTQFPPPLAEGIVIKTQRSNELGYLDMSDENSSNWTRFVRAASSSSEVNCVVIEEGSIFFLSTISLSPNTELRVAYSNEYAEKYHLPMMTLNEEENDQNLPQNIKILPQEKSQLRSKGAKKCSYSKLKKERRDWASADSDQEKQNAVGSNHGQMKFENPQTVEVPNLNHGQDLDALKNSQNVCEDEDSKGPLSSDLKRDLFEESSNNKNQRDKESSEHHADKGSGLPLKLKRTSAGQTFKCQDCYKSFCSKDKLAIHTESHRSESDKPFPCDRCGRRFSNKSALGSHLKLHSSDDKIFKVYQCPICQEEFLNFSSQKLHLTTHLSNGEYTCPFCSKTFQQYQKISRHIRAYHAFPVLCPHCQKHFPSCEKLKIHLLTHSNRRDFACPVCHKTFKRKDKMKEHLNRIHRRGSDQQTSDGSTKRSPARPKLNLPDVPEEVSGEEANSSAKKKKFVPQVDPLNYNQFTYKCDICYLGFKRRGMLVNHFTKRHPCVSLSSVPELNEPIVKSMRSFVCNHCNKTPKGIFVCNHCKKSYLSSAKRKAHILKNHPGQEVPPSIRSKESLDTKFAKVTRTYAAACPSCPRQYATRAKLLQHLRLRHGQSKLDGASNLSNQQPEPSIKEISNPDPNIPLELRLNDTANPDSIEIIHPENCDPVQASQETLSIEEGTDKILVAPSFIELDGRYALINPVTLSLRPGQFVSSVGSVSVPSDEKGDIVQNSSSAIAIDLERVKGSEGAQNISAPVLVWQPAVSFAQS